MPRKIIEKKDITFAESKALMEASGDDLGEFQRRTFDYLTKFTKISSKKAEKAVEKLISKFNLERLEAIQLVNCMPTSIEEIRSILTVKGKVILNETLQNILNELDNLRWEKLDFK